MGESDALRKLLRSTSAVAPMMMLTSALNGLLAVISARHLGADGRGALVLVITIVGLSSVLCSAGLTSAGRYHLVADYHRVPLGSYLGLSLAATLLQAPLGAVLVWVGLSLTGLRVDPTLVALGGLYAAVFLLAWLIREAMYAFGYVLRASLNNAGAVGVTAVAMGALAISDVDSYVPFIGALTLGCVTEILLDSSKLRSRGHSLRPRRTREDWRILLRRGIPALGLTVGQSLTFRIDRYILGLIVGPVAVGIYSIAATVSELLRLLPSALGQLAFFRTATGSASAQVLDRARTILLICMVPALGLMALFAPEIIELIFGDQFASAATPLRILLLGELAIMSFQIDSRVLTGMGATRVAGAIGLTGLVVVLLGDLLLIPHYEMVGAAWASSIAYLTIGVIARRALAAQRRDQSP